MSTTNPISDLSPTAQFSPCLKYRYCLTRAWRMLTTGTDSSVMFLMLNPSTADARMDDPTIRRCVGFARIWGHNRLIVTNLFAWRATDPGELYTSPDPVGKDNDDAILDAVKGCNLIIAAWGVHGAFKSRGVEVLAMLEKRGKQVHHLGLTKEGHPKHPLYLRADTQPTLFLKKVTSL